jgi:hypothetical protein
VKTPTSTATATTVTVALASAGTTPRVQVTLETAGVQAPWLAEAESTTRPEPRELLTPTAGAASGPLFETTIV